MKVILTAILFVYCMSLYPVVLQSTQERGFDAPVYYEAGKGNVDYKIEPRKGIEFNGWLYSKRVLPVFRALAILPYWAFLLVIHTASSIGLCALFMVCFRLRHRFPLACALSLFVIGAKASDVLCNGNITGALVGLSLTPAGALVATAFKPWYGVALLLHAAVWAASRRDASADFDTTSKLRCGDLDASTAGRDA